MAGDPHENAERGHHNVHRDGHSAKPSRGTTMGAVQQIDRAGENHEQATAREPERCLRELSRVTRRRHEMNYAEADGEPAQRCVGTMDQEVARVEGYGDGQ